MRCLPSLSTRDILPQSISSNLFPFHLLSSDGQLSSKSFEGPLGHTAERPVQLLLVIAFGRCNARDDCLRRHRRNRYRNGLGGAQRHIAIFVVVNIDVDLSIHSRRRRHGKLVDSTEPSIPGVELERWTSDGIQIACVLCPIQTNADMKRTRSYWENICWRPEQWQQLCHSQSGMHHTNS